MNGKIRIIGGQWRGRKLQVPDKQGLRPTPNRIRETLFNWLASELPGSSCLDLFAGSGALGIEAASRGAQHVVLVEQERAIVQSLKHQTQTFPNANNLEIVCADALKFLQQTPAKPFDIVFLDPPFAHNFQELCCNLLEQHGWLKPHAYIYIEAEHQLKTLKLPNASWQIVRQQTAGQVKFFLIMNYEL